jgi:hypothetical protein
MPPPAPASAPHVNCPVTSSHRSFELESAHAVRPRPRIVPEEKMFELVAVPRIVSPPLADPFPIVEELSEIIPAVKVFN